MRVYIRTFAVEGERRPLTPEQRLCLAVVEDSVNDLRRGRGTVRDRRAYDAAWVFFFAPDPDPSPWAGFTFERCAEVLGINAAAFREALLAHPPTQRIKRESQPTRRRAAA